jgi:hypothetical protein
VALVPPSEGHLHERKTELKSLNTSMQMACVCVAKDFAQLYIEITPRKKRVVVVGFMKHLPALHNLEFVYNAFSIGLMIR